MVVYRTRIDSGLSINLLPALHVYQIHGLTFQQGGAVRILSAPATFLSCNFTSNSAKENVSLQISSISSDDVTYML